MTTLIISSLRTAILTSAIVISSCHCFAQAHADEGRKVPLEKAQANIFLTRLWWEAVTPDSMHVEGDSIHFNPVSIGSALVRDGLKGAARKDGNIPFLGPKALSYAYTISWDDIRLALGFDDTVTPPDGYAGIKVYLAPKINSLESVDDLLDPEKCSEMIHEYETYETHVYVVAVKKSCEDTIDVIPSDSNGRFVYDLTTPCPNSCDDASPLYNCDSLTGNSSVLLQYCHQQ